MEPCPRCRVVRHVVERALRARALVIAQRASPRPHAVVGNMRILGASAAHAPLLVVLALTVACCSAIYTGLAVSQLKSALLAHHGHSGPPSGAGGAKCVTHQPGAQVAAPGTAAGAMVPLSCCAHSNEPRGLYLGDGKVFCHIAPLGVPMLLESADKGLTVHLCR